MKIAILGFGREGKSVLEFLKKSKQYKGADIEILDKKRDKNYLKNFERFELIFRSPGIPYNLPELRAARKKGVQFSSATKLFFAHCPARIIGVTGTKGKGTTSTLIYKILKAAKRDVYLAGNIGTSPLTILPKLKKGSIVVLELSSFQLQDLGESPQIAVVLDVFPDHQDSHLNLKEYYEAKTNIARHQKQSNSIFFFENHPLSRWIASKSRARKYPVDEKQFGLFAPEDLKIKGSHNYKNAVMAASVALRLDIRKNIIIRTAKSFKGLEHRLEFVTSLNGVYFYNDSASTNPNTTAAALHAFPDQPKILIAGGQDKGLNYAPLAKALKREPQTTVILFGENKRKINDAIKHPGANIQFATTLKDALQHAYSHAKKAGGDSVILFSPGAASFDMFQNYADRGERFKTFVKELTKMK
ncbi:MAG: UDP-N-acetylmuramoyl-L-alanine--D-glutamate ligase [Patescibacteria group bacterium]